jgi:hypothetical protein
MALKEMGLSLEQIGLMLDKEMSTEQNPRHVALETG